MKSRMYTWEGESEISDYELRIDVLEEGGLFHLLCLCASHTSRCSGWYVEPFLAT